MGWVDEGKRTRPLLTGEEDPVKKLEEIFNERKNMYAQADFQVNTEDKDINQISDEIINLLHANKKLSPFELNP